MVDGEKRQQNESQAQHDAIVREIEKLQAAIAQATTHADHAHNTSLQLSQEVSHC